MAQPERGSENRTESWIERLKRPQRMEHIEPVAARFIFSLRLIAVHHRAKRDPTSELTARLGNIAIAVKAFQLSETLCQTWPEPICLRPFCCQALSHDETTIAAMLEAAWSGQRDLFVDQLNGLVRRDRIEWLWRDCSELVASELAHI